ncbi:MAG TPA: PQQ-binding-like beta-propeller repeat protein [Cyclobacteriaceae bacterium]|nr:PQQ-binding-like beta-propeller repeat protein [Cyclobacteriaceae bacterium]
MIRGKQAFIIFFFIFSCEEKIPDHADRFTTWEITGGDPSTIRYSSLDQVNLENIKELKPAWVHHSGSLANVQCNPIVIGRRLFFTTGLQELIALDATNGEEIWRFKPVFDRVIRPEFLHVNRGVAYWTDGNEESLFYPSGNFLNAVNAKDGKSLLSFGKKGQVNFNAALQFEPSRMGITSSGSPIIYKDLVIVGCSSWSHGANVSAFNVVTGKRAWVFHTLPQPGQPGYQTYGDVDYWKTGAGVNVWGGFSMDEENGIIYFGTGQPKADFYRPENPGRHLFANSTVALDAASGKRLWHYQYIHHDLWDMDIPCPPVLTKLNINGKETLAAIQVTKTGNTFIFNRITGELLNKVEERPVPASQLAGEAAYPLQPFVLWPEPFSKQEITPDDYTPISQEESRSALERILNSDLKRFDPPSEKGIIYYGLHGGAEWGGPAYDPETNILYINSNEIAWHIQMLNLNPAATSSSRIEIHPGLLLYNTKACVVCHGADLKGTDNRPSLLNLKAKYTEEQLVKRIRDGGGEMPAFGSLDVEELNALVAFLLNQKIDSNIKSLRDSKPVYSVRGYNRFLDRNGYPATKPPWGTLNALNLNTGKLDWRIPFGYYPELLDKMGITGTENFGGPLVTKGGLLFIGATRDEMFRAFDKRTGELLWEYKLPFGGYATPSAYVIDGKQYIVIPATGGGKLNTTSGDVMIAFSL